MCAMTSKLYDRDLRNIAKMSRKSLTTKKKHRHDGMSRLASSKNVQWSAEDASNWVYSRTQDLVNLFRLGSGYFDE